MRTPTLDGGSVSAGLSREVGHARRRDADAAGISRSGRRIPELAAIRRALQTPPALALVEGEPGVGKTRLMRELCEDTADGDRPLRYLAVACPPFRVPLTLSPLIDAIHEMVTDPATVSDLGLSPLAGALRPLLGEWSEALPAPLEAEFAGRVPPGAVAEAVAAVHERFGTPCAGVRSADGRASGTRELSAMERWA